MSSGIRTICFLCAVFLLQTVWASPGGAAPRGWVDRTHPVGTTLEKIHSLDTEYRSLPPAFRKPAQPATSHAVGDREVFWAQSNEEWVTVEAECRAVTAQTYVFVALSDNYSYPVLDNGSNGGYVTQADADAVAAEFDRIHTADTQVFGDGPAAGVNGESRVTILLLDIDDSYRNGNWEDGFTGGYYITTDTWTEEYAAAQDVHSNERKMIYVDTYPALEDSETPDTEHSPTGVYSVLAHEYQHLIHDFMGPGESAWVDEGCSSLAEYICGYGLREPWTFASNTDDPLTDWKGEILDYEQVALFFLYLYENFGGAAAIRDIVANQSTSIAGINAVLSARGYAQRYDSILNDWLVANWLDDIALENGRYGYRGVELAQYGFASAASHSVYHVSDTGTVSHDAGDYISFTDGVPLSLFYHSDQGLEGFVIARGSGGTSVTPVSDGGVPFPGFGSTVNELVLVACAHDSSTAYSYYTSGDDSTPEPILPPPYALAADVPNDQGHRIIVTWAASPSEELGLVSRYRIYRSRLSTFIDPAIPLNTIRPDSIAVCEMMSTILVDSVSVGNTEFMDPWVPTNGVPYYYWVEAVGSSGVSAKAASGGPVAVREQARAFVLGQAWPNPFNPTTTISFSLPEPGNISLIVYDVTGRKVTELARGFHSAGMHAVTWNARDCASGVYFCTLRAGDRTETRKMLLMR